MLDELALLFDRADQQAGIQDYKRLAVAENALGKATQKTRQLTFKHLVDLFGLDPSIPVFRVFRILWDADASARPVLTLMLALVRDPILRATQEAILGSEIGSVVYRESIEVILAKDEPERFSAASLRSIAQNTNSSWTKAGFLSGRARKVRTIPRVSPAGAAFALFLGYLEGATGQRLFMGRWPRVLGTTVEELENLAVAASNRGLLVFLNAGGVKEVRFPGYLTAEEEALLHE